MVTITILCQDPTTQVLEAQLSDLLELSGQRGRSAEWRVSGVEATGPEAPRLHGTTDSGGVLDGDSLFAIARGVDQVIDGRFVAHDPGEPQPWLVLRAVDSTSWDVASMDAALMSAVRSRYPRIIECGDIAWCVDDPPRQTTQT